MKVYEIKRKEIKYEEKKLYALNNIDNEKLDENSEFLIASITKLFTAIALLTLHQEKKLNINDTFKEYLDNKELEKVKIIDVMNHISGIKCMPDLLNDRKLRRNKKYNNTTEVYNDFKDEKLIKHKKGDYSYSNLGYIFLGALIEKVTNTDYIDYITLKILKPLKMNNTGFGKINITPYNSKGKKLTKNFYNERTFAGSAGGLKSTAGDFIKFKNFYKLLTPETLKSLPETLKFYYNKDEDKLFNITANGSIEGGASYLKIKYDNNWKCKDVFLYFLTVIN
jgi:CubicO group peptidase (beta-lactamase class C family)